MSPKLLVVFFLSILSKQIFAQKYRTIENISYCKITDTDDYKKERCKLDLYVPTDGKNFSTIVWFHGGGLEEGNKFIPLELKEKGVAVVAVNYRLSPKVKAPDYIEDAAEAVAWAFSNVASYGGDPAKIYVSGHSAGGYLALMIGLDSTYLQKQGVSANKIKGLVPISGQTNTHYTIKKERGQSMAIPQMDQYAPISFARKDAPATVLITGDPQLELPARYEENAHLAAILKQVGHTKTSLYQLQGFDHGGVYAPGCLLMLKWIKELEK